MSTPIPKVLTVNFDNIPDELKALPQWCVWSYKWNAERKDWTKIPLQAGAALKGKGVFAKSNNPKTWSTFEEALEAYTLHPVPDGYTSDSSEMGLSGIGFFLSKDDPFLVIDLDKVLEDEAIINEDARSIVEALDSYTEILPSGKGLHIFVKTSKPGPKSRKGFLEMYDGSGARYLTVTGQVFHDAPIAERQEQIEEIYQRYLDNPSETQASKTSTSHAATSHNTHSDAELLEKMFANEKQGAKNTALWNGETSAYQSASEADLALCNSLAFWCNYDPARIDSLFRQSALYRPKWDERHSGDGATYGELTISTACEGKARGEGFQGKKKKGKKKTTLLTTKAKESKDDSVTPHDAEGENQIGCYVEKENQLFYRKDQGDDFFDTRLCNFVARITAQVERDDGAEITRHLAIEGTLANGRALPKASVPASQFGSMNWVLEYWGVAAIVSAGQSAKDKIREAVQMFSDKDGVAQETTYTHLGWREVNEWVYLHADGAIGKDGAVTSISVDAGSALNLYQLPEPKKPHDVLEAIQASFSMLEVAPDALTIVLFLSVYRAVIDTSDFALYLAGLTGVRKSELAALALQHFGSGLDSRHLPGNWSSTANSLETLAFAAKDALIVIDDFAPQGNQSEQAGYHARANRVLRAQGNAQGRGRSRPDGSNRPEKPPRGLILVTGEELASGHSIRARLLILEVKPNDVNLVKLTQCQKDAANSLYASALASFIQWLAPRLEQTREALKQRRNHYRASFISSHGRTTDACAELMFTADVWCDFARDAGFMSAQDVDAFKARVFTTLQKIAGNQAQHQRDADPVERFSLLLFATLTSGKAHLASVTGNSPESPERWGYKVQEKPGSYGSEKSYQAQGSKIGWLPDSFETEGIYLEPEAAYAAVQELAKQQGEILSMSKNVLYKRLAERGHIVTNEDDRNTRKVTVEGTRRNVVNLAPSYVVKSGTFGTSGTNETKSSVDESFTVPKSGGVPKIKRDSEEKRDTKSLTKSNVDEGSPESPESPDFTDTPPSGFLEHADDAVSEVTDDLSL